MSVYCSRLSKNLIVRSWAGMAIPSVYPGMTDGPGIGEKIAYVGIGRTGGELIEHVAQVRPRVETMPRRAAAPRAAYGTEFISSLTSWRNLKAR